MKLFDGFLPSRVCTMLEDQTHELTLELINRSHIKPATVKDLKHSIHQPFIINRMKNCPQSMADDPNQLDQRPTGSLPNIDKLFALFNSVYNILIRGSGGNHRGHNTIANIVSEKMTGVMICL